MNSLLIGLFSLMSLLAADDGADLLFAGDAMQHQAQLDAARQPDGTYGYDGCFDALKPYISSTDFAVVNLKPHLAELLTADILHSAHPTNMPML